MQSTAASVVPTSSSPAIIEIETAETSKMALREGKRVFRPAAARSAIVDSEARQRQLSERKRVMVMLTVCTLAFVVAYSPFRLLPLFKSDREITVGCFYLNVFFIIERCTVSVVCVFF
jgi:hypothetical protein